VETAAAVEIGGRMPAAAFLDDFHKLLGKASAKKLASAFPQLPQRRRRRLSNGDGTRGRNNTTFLVLPVAAASRSLEVWKQRQLRQIERLKANEQEWRRRI
jgi:hypothetical protein